VKTGVLFLLKKDKRFFEFLFEKLFLHEKSTPVFTRVLFRLFERTLNDLFYRYLLNSRRF